MTKPTSIRIDPATDAKLDEAAKLSGLHKADIMRFALTVGLKDLELIGYDVTAAIHSHVVAAKTGLQPRDRGPLKPNRANSRQG